MKQASIHCKPIPVMKTGLPLRSPSLQGKNYRFFPVKKNYTGKTPFSLQGGFAVLPQ